MFSYLRSSPIYAYIRKLKYRYDRRFLSKDKKTTIDDVRRILTINLGLRDGQAILVHCGFGYLNADFTPVELIDLLKDIVGKDGMIMMPFYPPGLSSDWLKSGRIFDPASIKCSTGVLAQTFAKDSDVLVSCHPIKAVAVWGKNNNKVIDKHHESLYPYDEKSPYFYLANIENSVSIGLGVRNCSIVHCAEDMFEHEKAYLYSDISYGGQVKFNNSIKEVTTFCHHGKIPLMKPSIYLATYYSDIIKSIIVDNIEYYSVNNIDLLDRMKPLMNSGVNRNRA